jgi:YYY domain-containing protein
VDLQGIWAVAWRSAVVFLLSTLFFQPFLSRFATAYVAFERWKGPRTGLGYYLGIHGLFLFVMLTWMCVELFGRESRGGPARMLRLGLRHWDRIPRLLTLYVRLVRGGRGYDALAWAVTGVVVLALAWLAKSRQWFYIFLLLLMLGTLLLVLRRRMQPERRLVWLLFGFGLALSLGVELIVLKGDIGRMNTVFKFYLQLWVFWAVGTAFALSQIAERSRAWTRRQRNLWWGVFGVLIFLAALYPVMAGKAKVQDRFDARAGPSLDGMAYMQYSVYGDNGQPIELKWDRDAIYWLLENVEGTPVIAEGNTEERGLYRWGSRVSINTGMPTILGWSWHQRQQRSAMPGQWIDRRLRDISTLYRDVDPSVAQEILKRYDVRYIYLGELERIYYPGPGLDKFEVMRAQGVLKLAYHNEKVMIYQVVTP